MRVAAPARAGEGGQTGTRRPPGKAGQPLRDVARDVAAARLHHYSLSRHLDARRGTRTGRRRRADRNETWQRER
jgi:hypothetical protein